MNTKMIWLSAPLLVVLAGCGSSRPDATEPGRAGEFQGMGEGPDTRDTDGSESSEDGDGLDGTARGPTGQWGGNSPGTQGMEGGPAQLPGTVPTTQPAPVPPGGAAPPGGTVPMSPGANGTNPGGTSPSGQPGGGLGALR